MARTNARPDARPDPDESGGRDVRQAERTPYRIRPSRLPLLWAVPGAAVSFALALGFLVYDGYGVWTMALGGIAALPCYLAAVRTHLAGHVVADKNGVTTRSALWSARRFRWKDVERIEIRPTTFGRKVAVVLRKGKGQYVLAAPRRTLFAGEPELQEKLDALKSRTRRNVPIDGGKAASRFRAPAVVLGAVAVMLLFEQPWLSDWWPGRKEAAALPRACSVADEGTVRRMLLRPVRAEDFHEDRDPYYTSACRWTHARPSGVVELGYQRYPRSGGQSGSGAADERMRFYRFTLGTVRIRRLGDEAWQRAEELPGRTRHVDVWARRANVIVHVDRAGDGTEAELTAEARALAREAMGRLRLK